MQLTVLIILAILALVSAIFSALNKDKYPLWVSVILPCVYALVQQLPVGNN